ncbi:Gamma-tubulin complex component 2 [Echinococcus granulosus]|uniref:Gamma-tubulin complex component n=1 Tax=Echinococcus granulosus TaxID=6210 RepID=A0A068WLD2_ECHGR|nr:Gamma-tubulin complex component 2 [Echinococcus granulosus]CDS18430.1 gamma tubulin complex component 2 [Echinococcus granulosus]
MDAVKSAILHDTNELLQAIYGQPVDRAIVNTYADQLIKTITPRSSSQKNVEQAKKVLLDGNPGGKAFLAKYNELKLKNIRELDPLVYLLGKIKCDPELLRLLHNSDKECNDISDGSDYESFDQLQMRIQNSNTNAILGPLRPGDFTGLETDENLQQFHENLGSVRDPQQLPHYYATYATADRTEVTKSTLKPKESGSEYRKALRQFPQWMYEVFYLSSDFLPENLFTSKTPSILPLETLPLNVQEKLIVQDLLACLQGSDGVYVKALKIKDPHAVRNFAIDEKMHPSLVDTVNKVVPMISQYSLIVRFIEEKSRYEYGRVNQALCEAMEQFLQEYWKLLCQLEAQYRANQLGISRLLLLLKETSHLFSQLAQLATNINTGGCVGGATLSLLYEGLRGQVSVISRVHDCLLYLLRSACRPFFDSLSFWLYRGFLRPDDAERGEFFIVKSSALPLPSQENDAARDYINSAYYWERSYSILSTQLPGFLESRAEKVLATGKYLNVVQQCDSSLQLAEPEDLVFSETENDFLTKIDRAHAFASRTLLDFILKQKDLKGILKSIKRYFLLDQGDFIVHFMDTAAAELKKPISQVSISGLNSLLEWVLQTSSAACDPYKDNLKVVSTNCDLITQMLTLHVAADGSNVDTIIDMDPSALEALSLDYKVEWPTALVINRPVIDRYQMLFRHLFYCRHVERHLSTSWAMRKAVRRATAAGALAFNNAFILGQRMLTYIQNLQYYMTFEVLEPNWHSFFQFLNKADNLDEVLKAHERCLEICMDDCLLTSPDLLALVGKLNAVCIQFANCLNRLADASLDDTLDSVPMSTAASMHHRRGVTTDTGVAGAVSASPSFTNLALTSAPALPRGDRWRCGSMASSDGGSLFKAGDTTTSSSLAGSSLDMRRRVAASDLGSIGSNERFAIAVEDFGLKFNSLIVDLLVKIRRPVDRERDKLLSLAARLDFNGFYTRYSLDAVTRGSAVDGSLGSGSGLGSLPRPSSSMGSLATLEGLSTAPPRRLTAAGDEESAPPLATPQRPRKSAIPPPPQPRDRRHTTAHHLPPAPTSTMSEY